MVKNDNRKVVFVGLSGGVDSAVSAALLQKQGYNVVGVFIRTWHPEYLLCNEEVERRDAMRVAAHLNIPFLTFNFEKIYKKEVADYMIAEYRAGRTPNPDVMCNKEVKFGAFLKKSLAMGADYVATGHYAINAKGNTLPEHAKIFQRNYRFVLGSRLSRDKLLTAPSLEPAEVLEKYFLLRSPDPAKDQSYFLWTLNQKQLSKIIFPIGHLKKTEVRKLAKKFKLPVAEKKDSQGICFLGAVDLKEFLKHYIKEKKGEVILVPSEVEGDKKNNVIGWHNGAVFHTLGERHGFVVKKKSANDKAYYVVSKNVKRNILFVSQNKNASLIHANKRIVLKNTNWVSGQNPTFNFPLSTFNLTCQIRYHGELLPCQVKITGKTKAKIIFQKPVLVASGQSCVIYDKNICLGGGVVI